VVRVTREEMQKKACHGNGIKLIIVSMEEMEVGCKGQR